MKEDEPLDFPVNSPPGAVEFTSVGLPVETFPAERPRMVVGRLSCRHELPSDGLPPVASFHQGSHATRVYCFVNKSWASKLRKHSAQLFSWSGGKSWWLLPSDCAKHINVLVEENREQHFHIEVSAKNISTCIAAEHHRRSPADSSRSYAANTNPAQTKPRLGIGNRLGAQHEFLLQLPRSKKLLGGGHRY